MAKDRNRILVRRGASDKLYPNTPTSEQQENLSLSNGELLYDKDKNYLLVGNGADLPKYILPLSTNNIKGFFGDILSNNVNNQPETSGGTYGLYGYDNTLNIWSDINLNLNSGEKLDINIGEVNILNYPSSSNPTWGNKNDVLKLYDNVTAKNIQVDNLYSPNINLSNNVPFIEFNAKNNVGNLQINAPSMFLNNSSSEDFNLYRSTNTSAISEKILTLPGGANSGTIQFNWNIDASNKTVKAQILQVGNWQTIGNITGGGLTTGTGSYLDASGNSRFSNTLTVGGTVNNVSNHVYMDGANFRIIRSSTSNSYLSIGPSIGNYYYQFYPNRLYTTKPIVSSSSITSSSLNATSLHIGNVNNSSTSTGGAANDSTKCTIDSAGNVTALTFNALSDIRLKENINIFMNNNSILNLDIKTFNFKNNEENHIGLIAQDLQEIYPELVNENENGYLSIKESKLIYVLINECQRLRDRIEKLEER